MERVATVTTRDAVRSRRLLSTVGLLTVVGVVTIPPQMASSSPKPSAHDIQSKLNKLNRKADHLDDQYNQARVDVRNARKKVKKLDRQITKDKKSVGHMRGKVATMASAAWQSDGNMTSTSTMFSSSHPQRVLDQIASINHLSNSQLASIKRFLRTDAKVRKEQRSASKQLKAAKKAEAKVRGKRAKIIKLAKHQKHLLSELPASQQPHPGTGGSYTGPATGSARKALQFAYAQKGKPYQYGATGPSAYDCSGLTMKSWAAGGVSLPRTSEAQYSAGPHVSLSSLQPGDLVFYNSNSHVAMYVGGGKIIQAPHTGAYVEVTPLSGGGTPDGAVRP